MITTHILDVARGVPAAAVQVLLEFRGEGGDWQSISRGTTDLDGRLKTLYPASRPFVPGVYRLTFDTDGYFETQGTDAFYPEVVVVFETAPGEKHYHVPLLLSPFGYRRTEGRKIWLLRC